MNKKRTSRYTFFVVWITLTAIAASLLFWRKPASECFATQGQTVVRWKDLYYGSCKQWHWYCMWPIRRAHRTYKITLHEGIPIHDAEGFPVVVAGGKIRKWEIYDSSTWNELVNRPRGWKNFVDYEPIEENEFVVLVETRYRLFHNVEADLRICTQGP